MKIIYDNETDTLTLILNNGKIYESDEIKDGLILDYDDKGKVVSMEFLDASFQLNDPKSISYELKEFKQAV